MKKLFNKSSILAIGLLTINTAMFADSESGLATKPSVAGTSMLENLQTWGQEAKTAFEEAPSKIKTWLSEKLGVELRPEKLRESLAELRTKIESATPEELKLFAEQVQQKIADLQEKVRTATADQKIKFQEMLINVKEAANDLRNKIRQRIAELDAKMRTANAAEKAKFQQMGAKFKEMLNELGQVASGRMQEMKKIASE